MRIGAPGLSPAPTYAAGAAVYAASGRDAAARTGLREFGLVFASRGAGFWATVAACALENRMVQRQHSRADRGQEKTRDAQTPGDSVHDPAR